MRVDAGVPCIAQGIPVTNVLASAVDALVVSSFPEGLAVADSAMRLFGITHAELEQEVGRRARGRRGAETARRVAAAANPLSENGGESFARGVMIEEGFQEPLLQVEIPDPVQKGRVHRVDYLWGSPERPVVIGELDGREKLESSEMRQGKSMVEVLRDERTRESRLSLTGARIVRFTFADVLQRRRFAAILDKFGVPRSHVMPTSKG